MIVVTDITLWDVTSCRYVKSSRLIFTDVSGGVFCFSI